MAFPVDWELKAKITVQAAQISGTLTDWPMWIDDRMILVNNPNMIDGDHADRALSNGGDIRFSSDADGLIQLSCEIEEFTLNNDPTLSRVSIWVKVPSAAVGTELYIWWKKPGESQPAAGAAYGSQSVWNSNYVFVLHANAQANTGGANLPDSTSGARHFTPQGANLPLTTGANAKIRDKAIDFNGSTAYATRADDVGLKPANISFQGWFNVDQVTTYRIIYMKTNGGSWLLGSGLDFRGSTSTLTFWVNHFLTTPTLVQGTIPGTGQWFFVAVTFDGATLKIKVNNNAWVTKAYAAAINWDTDAFHLGYHTGGSYHDGRMDEIRYHNVARAQAWFDADYLNQSAPTTFAVMAAGVPNAPEPVYGAPLEMETLSYEGDIRLFLTEGVGGLGLTQNDLDRDSGLETAVLISLLTDRRADLEDSLPDSSKDLRGWWADATLPDINSVPDKIGSRLWLLSRSKMEDETNTDAEKFCLEAMQWMLDDSVADSLEVTVTRMDTDTISIEMIIRRPQGTKDITFKYYFNWEAQSLRRGI